MKSTKSRLFLNCFCCIGLAGSALLAVPARADTPAFVLGSVSTARPSSFEGTRGWGFQRGSGSPNAELLITQLGVFDSGGDGLVNSHAIGLWDNVTGRLLASATVPAGTDAPFSDGYRWVSISPVLIPYVPAFYVLGAQYLAGDADALVTPRPSPDPRFPGVFSFAPELAVDDRYGRIWPGPDLHWPNAIKQPPCEGCAGERFFEPNLQFTVVPEPSVWFVVAPVLVWLLFRYRKAVAVVGSGCH